MTVFVSYARNDRAVVESLTRDLERARHQVWMDDELTGGQAWWSTILDQIRTCDLFVFALSPDSLRSRACQSELSYAADLGRPILPVMVNKVSIQLAPSVISNAQFIDYTERSADSAVGLVTAAASMPPAAPLPDPLPDEPPTPMSYMNPYREQLRANEMSYSQQAQLVVSLRHHLDDEDERAAARGLLDELRRRQDIVESVGRDIDEILASTPASTPESFGPTPRAASSGAWHPDPTGRHQQRYWDGSEWTKHVSSGGQTSVDPIGSGSSGRGAQQAAQPLDGAGNVAQPTPPRSPTPPSHPATPSTGARAEPFSSGMFIALIIGTVLVGIIGVIAGAINLKHPARKGQAQLLLWLGVGIIIVNILLLTSGG